MSMSLGGTSLMSGSNLSTRRGRTTVRVKRLRTLAAQIQSFSYKVRQIELDCIRGDVRVRSTAPVCLHNCPCCEKEGRVKEVYEGVKLRWNLRARFCGGGAGGSSHFHKSCTITDQFRQLVAGRDAGNKSCPMTSSALISQSWLVGF